MAERKTLSLSGARAAVKNREYETALEGYRYFFEHAQDEDPHSNYGVRLSYCLDEWASLGEEYEPAMEALEVLAVKVIALLDKTRNPERFNDYISICKYLRRESLPVERFIHYHNLDRELATTLVRFIWAGLVDSEMWEVCNIYLPDPMSSYDKVMVNCDKAMDVYLEDPKSYGDSLAYQIRGWYVRDVSNIILVLKNSSRGGEIDPILEKMKVDMAIRKCSDLAEQIDSSVA